MQVKDFLGDRLDPVQRAGVCGSLFTRVDTSNAPLLTRAGFRVVKLQGIPSPQNLCATLNLGAQQGARRRSNIHSVYFSKPALIAAAYPFEWLLAKAKLSGEPIALASRSSY